MSWVRPALEEIEPYRPGKRASEVRRELGLDEVVKLSSNESPYPPVPAALDAIASVAGKLNRYPDGAAVILKERLAGFLDVPAASLLVGNGSNELLRLLADVILEPGDEVVAAVPSFIVYPMVARLRGAVMVEVPLLGQAHDLEAMAKAVGPRTRLIFVCNPNNPTGTIVPAAAVRAFLAAVPQDVVVCFDEAYHEYVTDPDYRTALEFRDEHPNIVVLRTFSKIFGLAGLRIGYGVAAPVIVETVDKVREPFNVNTVAQVAAYYSLDSAEEISRRARENAVERDFVEGELDALGFARAESQTNFVYFDCGLPAMEAFERLQRQGVIVRAFGRSRFIRATLGLRSENERLVAALGNL